MQAEFWGYGRGKSLSNQRDFVGLEQGSDAQFLLNQGTSDFALLDFPLTFQDAFLVLKFKKNSQTLEFSPLSSFIKG